MELFYDTMIQMYNGILQCLDLQLEVPYPINYIAKAIPENHAFKSSTLKICRFLMLHDETPWKDYIGGQQQNYIHESLFHHPRYIAKYLLELALSVLGNQQDEFGNTTYSSEEIDHIM
mgnify:CR=1 FL=1